MWIVKMLQIHSSDLHSKWNSGDRGEREKTELISLPNTKLQTKYVDCILFTFAHFYLAENFVIMLCITQTTFELPAEVISYKKHNDWSKRSVERLASKFSPRIFQTSSLRLYISRWLSGLLIENFVARQLSLFSQHHEMDNLPWFRFCISERGWIPLLHLPFLGLIWI